jgi:GntR family transcriptional regulator
MARTVNARLENAALSNDVRMPLYNQIFLILRNKIIDGEYANGSFLPSEFEIANGFNVSRITAKRALNELAEAGLAVRQRGRGTRVRYKGGGTIVSGSVQSLVDSLRANARNEGAKVLEFEYVPASAEVACALRVPPGTIVQRAVRVCSASGTPYSHLTTYVPESIGRTWTAADFERRGLVSLLERAGVPVEFAEQRITAAAADNPVAAALKVAIGSPLLRAVRVSYAKHEAPTEYLIALYPPDRYQFIVTLTNDSEDARQGD